MHLVEVTIPSGMVSFGNVKPSIAVKDPTDLAEVAAAYLEACAKYKLAEEGYVAAKRAGIEADKVTPSVTYPEGPAEAAPDQPSEPPFGPLADDDEDVLDQAAQTLTEGLGGATVVEDEEAPWAKESTADQPKPWDVAPPVFDWS